MAHTRYPGRFPLLSESKCGRGLIILFLSAKKSRGFSLIELITVVVIIGILVSIAILVYDGTQARARETADDANVRILNGSCSHVIARDPCLAGEFH